MKANADAPGRGRGAEATTFDLVIAGGRVIDPETGTDDVRDVGLLGDRIAAVSPFSLSGRRRIDARGLVVSPGFIDLHSHGQGIAESRLQALDGVTSALELEAGAAPVSAAYARAAAEGRPINYGYSASWAALRMHVVAGSPLGGGARGPFDGIGGDAWRAAASSTQTAKLLDLLDRQLGDGALGIGILIGYAPAISPAEYVAVAAVAAAAGVPAFTHARPLVEQDPHVAVDGAEEITRVAGQTGAQMHYCHVNSTSTRHLEKVQGLIESVRAEGAEVTSEVYPYGSGMTAIGADYFHPDRLHLLGATGTPNDVIYAPTGETLTSFERLAELRTADPSGLAFIRWFDEDEATEHIVRMATLAHSVVASDAMPFVIEPGNVYDPMQWPLPPFLRTHPRGAGTFARTLRIAVRETGALALIDAVAKCTIGPARVLERAVPAMRRKGRLQAGCDADIIVFDADDVQDLATYQQPTRHSRGFRHVLVHGEPVVTDGDLQLDAFPGRPIRR